jgi:hypothetical protein
VWDVQEALVGSILNKENFLGKASQLIDGAIQENARRGNAEATAVVRELYGSLTQLLARFAHEPDRFVGGGGVWILDSYHPNLCFHQDKAKRKHAR